MLFRQRKIVIVIVIVFFANNFVKSSSIDVVKPSNHIKLIDGKCWIKGKVCSLPSEIWTIHKSIQDRRYLNKNTLLVPYNNNIKASQLVVFYGGTGVGKTMTAQELAKASDCYLCKIVMADMQNKFVASAKEHLKKQCNDFLSKAIQHGGGVLVLDDAQSVEIRGDSVKASESRMAFAWFWDWATKVVEQNYEVTIIITTNDIKELPSQLKSRIRTMVEFSGPNVQQRIKLLKNLLCKTFDPNFTMFMKIISPLYKQLPEKIIQKHNKKINQVFASIKSVFMGINTITYEELVTNSREKNRLIKEIVSTIKTINELSANLHSQVCKINSDEPCIIKKSYSLIKNAIFESILTEEEVKKVDIFLRELVAALDLSARFLGKQPYCPSDELLKDLENSDLKIGHRDIVTCAEKCIEIAFRKNEGVISDDIFREVLANIIKEVVERTKTENYDKKIKKMKDKNVEMSNIKLKHETSSVALKRDDVTKTLQLKNAARQAGSDEYSAPNKYTQLVDCIPSGGGGEINLLSVAIGAGKNGAKACLSSKVNPKFENLDNKDLLNKEAKKVVKELERQYENETEQRDLNQEENNQKVDKDLKKADRKESDKHKILKNKLIKIIKGNNDQFIKYFSNGMPLSKVRNIVDSFSEEEKLKSGNKVKEFFWLLERRVLTEDFNAKWNEVRDAGKYTLLAASVWGPGFVGPALFGSKLVALWNVRKRANNKLKELSKKYNKTGVIEL